MAACTIGFYFSEVEELLIVWVCINGGIQLVKDVEPMWSFLKNVYESIARSRLRLDIDEFHVLSQEGDFLLAIIFFDFFHGFMIMERFPQIEQKGILLSEIYVTVVSIGKNIVTLHL